MRTKTLVVGGIAVGVAVLLGQHDALAKKGGTDILHLSVDVTMTGTGVDADAEGSASADHKTQGNANHQSLEIEVQNLDANTTYDLVAIVDDGTNVVAQIQTDANGNATVKYAKQGNVNSNASPHGDPLPNELDPVSNITALQVVNISTQTVLNADFTNPDKLQYLVKRNLSDGDVSGALRIKSNGNNAQFRLRVSGLEPSATHYLAINGDIATSYTSDGNGGLNITALPGGSPDVLDITEIGILNSTSNSVLSTALP